MSPPLAEPVSLAELKEYCRVEQDDTAQDNTLLTLALGSRSWAEGFARRRFVKQSWRLLLDFFPGYVSPVPSERLGIELPYPPARSVDAFRYLNANGSQTAMVGATDYVLDLESNPARLIPPFGKMWPVARITANAVRVDFTLGYAEPVTVSTASPAVLDQVASSDYTFVATDVGRPISIPDGGPDGKTLNTIVAGITSPPSGTCTLRDELAGAIAGQTALLVNAANGNPAHWEMIRDAIKMLVAHRYDRRAPNGMGIPQNVKDLLYMVRP